MNAWARAWGASWGGAWGGLQGPVPGRRDDDGTPGGPWSQIGQADYLRALAKARPNVDSERRAAARRRKRRIVLAAVILKAN